MAGKPGTGKGRKKNREGVYFRDDVAEHMQKFYRERPFFSSKSRMIETAVDFYMTMAEQYGLDHRHWPIVDAGKQKKSLRPIPWT